MRKLVLMFTWLFFVLAFMNAQTKQITGTVKSAEDGGTLPGVTIQVKGTTLGTISDFDGNFSLQVPSDANILVFSFVGLETQEVNIAGQTAIEVFLQEGYVDMEEVLVVAYGTKTKKSIVGAVTSIDSDVISNQISASPLRAIQGSSPGVNILTTGGQPGENPTIRIRGIGSNVNADPLIVVDGVVFSGNINSISSDQIETINILKDASASVLYGSRASNGVILISTKGGRFGAKKANVNVNFRAGYSSPAVKTFDLVGSEDYMKYTWEAMRNSGLADEKTAAEAAQAATDGIIGALGYNPYSVAQPVGVDGQIASGAQLLWDTDWYSALIRDQASYDEVSFTADGATDNLTYFVAGNRLSQQGAVIESDFNRVSGRVNLGVKLNSWLELGTNNSFSKSTQNYPTQAGNSYTNTMQWIYTISNIYPLYQRDVNGGLILDDFGKPIYDYGNRGGTNGTRPLLGGDNAVGSTYYHDILNRRTSFLSTSFLTAKITDWLRFKSTFGYENYLYDNNEYTHNNFGHAANVGGRVSQERTITETKSFTNALTFDKAFGSHNVSADLISETFDFSYDYLDAQGTGFLPNVKVLSGSTVPEGVAGYVNSERLVSVMGRLNYDFGDKYFLDFSYRTDASTRFKAGNRWGGYYSFGASWILSDEAFLEDVTSLSLLKLRASYGELGNNSGIGYFPYLSSYDTDWNNNNNTGVLKGSYADEDIKWEKTSMFNIGLDYGIFNNRISGTLEYYNRESIDLLFLKPLAPSTGDVSYYTNIGIVSNRGVEFQIQTINFDTRDFFWKTSFNISNNINEILELPQDDIVSGTKKLRVGKSLYDFFIYEYAGVDSETGEALWYKDEGDVITDEDGEFVLDSDGRKTYENYEKVTTNDYSEADKYYFGSSLPEFIGGLNSYMQFKGFDLNVLFNYSLGAKIYDSSYAGLMGSGSRPGQQWTTDIEQRWQNPGDVTDVPKLLASQNNYNAQSTRFLFDNDYVRLKALTFGYNLPNSLMRKVNLQSLRIYLQADNIWTWQSHKGIDPEQNIAGTTDHRSNIIKTYSVGINIGL